MVQRLLRESGRDGVPDDVVSIEPQGLEAQADWDHLRSPETYLNQAPPGLGADGLKLNQWALLGDWRTGARASVLQRAGGGIAYRFHARDVNLVLGPAKSDGPPIPFHVTLDGRPPGPAAGLDVDSDGRGEVAQQRLYQLIRRPGETADLTFRIDFDAPGIEAYVFTFG